MAMSTNAKNVKKDVSSNYRENIGHYKEYEQDRKSVKRNIQKDAVFLEKTNPIKYAAHAIVLIL